AQEYWPGDPPYLPAAVLPDDLNRRDQRDAARALRGTLLRAELYGLDDTPFSTAPYTVTEESSVAVLIVAPTIAPRVETTVYIDELFEYRQVEAGDGVVTRGNLLHIRDGSRHLAIMRYGVDPVGDGSALTVQIADEIGSSVIALGLDRWKNVEEYSP